MKWMMLCLTMLLPLTAMAAPMEKVGSARLRVMMLSVYDAALYAPEGTYDAQAPHALALTYRMNFMRDEIIDRTLQEIADAQTLSDAQAKRWRAELERVIPDVKDGDTIKATARPGRDLRFTHNGKKTGVVTDTTLIAPFMNIWLGPKTNEPGLRDKLLGKK
ncbi:MAG: hypothetical protein DI582_06600 [Azospirillum brasilense]|nr:MAG: hypothetical protein DI582_06600 [Azospirillum brasilense]